MITTLNSIFICLQQSAQKLITENKSLIVINTELVNQSKHAPYGIPLDRNEKIATSLPRPLLGLAVEVNNNVSSWIEGNVSELQQFPDHIGRL